VCQPIDAQAPLALDAQAGAKWASHAIKAIDAAMARPCSVSNAIPQGRKPGKEPHQPYVHVNKRWMCCRFSGVVFLSSLNCLLT
jgi:hypothetical protein